MSTRVSDANASVFVVDDDASIREAVKTLLRSVGLRAQVFSSAEEFLRANLADSPSCLVLDVKLPGINGLDFQEQLDRAGIQIPIIFISAHGDIPMNLRALRAGAIDFLAKPFQKEQLLTAIYQALERDRTQRASATELSVLQTGMERLRSREREANFDLAVLNKMASRLSTADPLRDVLSEVIEFVTGIVTCDSCLIYLLEGDELVLRSSKNHRPEVVDRLSMKVGQGITGWVAENKTVVVIPQRAYEDPRFRMLNELPEDRFEAFLSVPLVCGGRLVGVINLQNRLPYQYTQREVSLVIAMGFLVGAEVERARLESENTALSERLGNRKLIERAKGVLERDLGLTEADAYRMLQRESQRRRKSMKEVAEAIILTEEMKHPS